MNDDVIRKPRQASPVSAGDTTRIVRRGDEPIDVVALCTALIRFDTSNYGGGRSAGETEAAEFVAARIRSAGFEPQVIGAEPDRMNVVLRVPGTDAAAGGLLVHGHLDVVPAEAEQWSAPPFEAVVRDGYLCGRGAVDMKDMCAMMLAAILAWGREGIRPKRDVVFAFVADEEDNGAAGAGWLVETHPELFDGVEAAIGESGGVPLIASDAHGDPVRMYPVATAERGTMHVRLSASGTAGHGSRPTTDNAVTSIVEAVHRIAAHAWPVHLSETVRSSLVQCADALRVEIDLSSDSGVEAAVSALGSAGETARFTIRASTTPTMLNAGYKVNVIPGIAQAELDVRCPPGFEHQLIATLDSLVGSRVVRTFTAMNAPVEAAVDSHFFRAMREAITRHDPDAVVVPYCMGGGTDAKAFTPLGIACYGFAPLGLDSDGRVPSAAHGVDERIPVAALLAGARILRDFLEAV